MNDQPPAEAVDTKPPAARPRAPRKRPSTVSSQPGPDTPPGEAAGAVAAGPVKAATETESEQSSPPAKPASRGRRKADSDGEQPAPGKDKDAGGDAEPVAGSAKPRATRSRTRKPRPAADADPGSDQQDKAEAAPEAPPERQRRPRPARGAAGKADGGTPATSAAADDQGAGEPSASRAEQSGRAEEPGQPEDSKQEEGSGGTRSRRRRSSRTPPGGRRDQTAKEGPDESGGQQAPKGSGSSGDDGPTAGSDAGSEPARRDSPAQESNGDGSEPSASAPGRTRSRRRRSRRGGSGGGTDQRSNGASATDAAAPSSSAGASSAPAAVEGQSEGARPDSRSSSAKGRGRRRTRRARPEQIPPRGPLKMLVSTQDRRSQIAVLEGRDLIEHYVAKDEDESIVGNIYIGRVENVLPGMEAAFLDIGEARNAVLYVGEVSYDEADLEGPAPRIETLLKSGQAVVAQVTKDPMGHKGARLTTEVSLAGRYLVMVPDAGSLGISRRLADGERRRLRDIANRIRPAGHGMIVRTAAMGATEEDLERDMARLTRIWEEVSERIDGTKPPKLIYSEPPLAIRVARDLFTADVEQVIVDSEISYDQIRGYLDEVAPDYGDRVELYTDPMSLFERFHVLEQVRKAVDRKVWLPSGGHIVIERTEAMTVVDVNTGRFVGRSTLEDTVLHANLEAAEEIAKQLRLRDIGGIIVIDFIDMNYERNRDELLRTFERALMRDKTRTQVYGVSELGLIQMTRKRVSEGLLEALSQKCEACEGRGVILGEIS